MELSFGTGDTVGRSCALWLPCLASEISPGSFLGCSGVPGSLLAGGCGVHDGVYFCLGHKKEIIGFAMVAAVVVEPIIHKEVGHEKCLVGVLVLLFVL